MNKVRWIAGMLAFVFLTLTAFAQEGSKREELERELEKARNRQAEIEKQLAEMDQNKQADEFFAFENRPKLKGASPEPVTFRYKLKAGQVAKVEMKTNLETIIRQGGQSMTIAQIMAINAKLAVTDVDGEGNISAVVKITRMQMKVSGPSDVEFDSDNPDAADENFKPLAAMINVGIPCKMSPIGKLLETDLEPMRLAIRRAGNAALEKVFEESTEKMFEGTFVELSEAPIKQGDTYEAGTIVEENIKIHAAYRIGAVSADRKQAIMEPRGRIEFGEEAFPGCKVKIRTNRIDGWILFNLERGFADAAEIRLAMSMDIEAEGEAPGTAEIRVKSSITSTLE